MVTVYVERDNIHWSMTFQGLSVHIDIVPGTQQALDKYL